MPPETVLLQSSRSGWIFHCIGSAAFVVIGALLLHQEPALWFTIAFFGLCLAVGVLKAIKGGSLTLTAERFREQGPFKDTFIPWSEAGLFWPAPSGVHFDWVERRHWGLLSENYGKSGKELADLMNDMRTLYAEN